MAKKPNWAPVRFTEEELWLLHRALTDYEAELLGLPSDTCPVEDIPTEPPPEKAEEYYAAAELRSRIQRWVLPRALAAARAEPREVH